MPAQPAAGSGPWPMAESHLLRVAPPAVPRARVLADVRPHQGRGAGESCHGSAAAAGGARCCRTRRHSDAARAVGQKQGHRRNPGPLLRRPKRVSSTKYVIWLEGGGICQSLADCIGRANSALGSSKSFPQTFEIGQPMMQVLSCSVRCCRARPLDMTSPRCGHAERLPCQSWVLRVEPRLPTLRLGRHLDRNGPGTTQSVPSNSFGLGGGRSVDGVSQFSLIFSSLCPRNETEL